MKLTEVKYGTTTSTVFIHDLQVEEKLIGPFSSHQEAQKFIDTLSGMFKKYFGEWAEDYDHLNPVHHLNISAPEDPQNRMEEIHGEIKSKAVSTVERRSRVNRKKKAVRRRTKKKVSRRGRPPNRLP